MDNQLPFTLTPVLFRPQKVGDEADYILKFSMTLQKNESLDLRVYPYIGFHVSFSYFGLVGEMVMIYFVRS